MPIILQKPEVGLTEGQVGVITPGTGFSMPPGIESIYEYNGVYLNNRTWVDKIRITDIGGFELPEIRDSRENNPTAHGETPFNAFYSGRTIVLTGRIEAFTLEKLRDMQQGLRMAFSDLIERPLIIRTGRTDRDAYIPCRTTAFTMAETQRDLRFFRDFQITLRASNPRLLSYKRSLVTLEPELDDDTSLYTAQADVFNRGGFQAQPVFVLTGEMENPVIYNRTTGQTLSIDGTIPSGDQWTINVEKNTMVDQNGDSVFGFLADDAEWIELDPRNNTIQLEAESVSGTPSLGIFWRHTWL